MDPARPGAVAAESAPADAELLARAFSAAPNGFVLIDAAGTIIAANAALESMFGLEAGAVIGHSIETLVPAALRADHAAHRARFYDQPEQRFMGAGRVLHGRHADGREFPVEIGLNPVPSARGMLVLASVIDVSERIALEHAFHGLFDASPYGLVIVDDGGKIAMANPTLANSLGYRVAELVGKSLHALLPERYRGRHDLLMSDYRRTGESRMMGQGRDLTALHADGTELPVEIGLSRVRWRQGMVTLAAVIDIGARKRLELALRQANANLEEFTYVASHDLRSPLRGIADLVEWIGDDLGSGAPESVRKNLDRIALRIRRMDRLMDDLLSYARAGRAATTYVSVNLNELVRGILELQPLPPGFRIELDLNVEPFQATPTPLETSVRNLLSNAVKHHDRGQGLIRVVAKHDDSHCIIGVVDDGPGVHKSAQERVFKLFQTATDRGGSGIGLALTKRLVEVHGGRIELESPVADGRGAAFRIRWPRFPRRDSGG